MKKVNTKRDKEILKLHLQEFKTQYIARKYGLSMRRCREVIRDMKKLDNIT